MSLPLILTTLHLLASVTHHHANLPSTSAPAPALLPSAEQAHSFTTYIFRQPSARLAAGGWQHPPGTPTTTATDPGPAVRSPSDTAAMRCSPPSCLAMPASPARRCSFSPSTNGGSQFPIFRIVNFGCRRAARPLRCGRGGEDSSPQLLARPRLAGEPG